MYKKENLHDSDAFNVYETINRMHTRNGPLM